MEKTIISPDIRGKTLLFIKTTYYGNNQTKQNKPTAPKRIERHILGRNPQNTWDNHIGKRSAGKSRPEYGKSLPEYFPAGKERRNDRKHQCQYENHSVRAFTAGTLPVEKNSRTVVFPRRFARLHRKHRFSTEKVNAPYEPPRPEIAWRYLFSKKSHSAINAISIVSVCGVAITTLALVCTLSVYNGFTELIGSLYSQIDPQIKITPLQGKTLDTEEEAIEQIAEWNEVKTFTPVIEENALCIYKDRQRPVLVKGVPDNYTELSHIQDIVTSGTFQLNDGRIDYVSLGISVAGQLGVVANSPYPVELYAPNRLGKVNLANPSQSFNGRRIFVSSTFCANQAIYDDQLAIIPLSTAREMFSYTTEATAIELRLTPTTNENEFAKKLREHLGDAYRVATHMQQNDWYKWVQIEKWITFLILSFILMIATFNVIGALSMLIIDKKRDIDTLQNLGADDRLISKIFLVEGWLISAIGAGSGLILGVILCYLQQEYGILKLGSSEGVFITDAYPVKLELLDTLAVTAIVLILGFVTAWYPAKFLRKRLLTAKQNEQ